MYDANLKAVLGSVIPRPIYSNHVVQYAENLHDLHAYIYSHSVTQYTSKTYTCIPVTSSLSQTNSRCFPEASFKGHGVSGPPTFVILHNTKAQRPYQSHGL